MKKSIGKLFVTLSAALCLLSVPVLAADDVAINRDNFPDANFRSYVSENFDTDSNGKLSAAEMAAAKKIDVSFGQIRSLQGIEYFGALTELNCSSNPLTRLDVSKNPALTELDCFRTGLTTLDLSKNTALTMLNCSCNQLTELDVSSNTALTYLACTDNELTSLDISGNIALTGLYCYTNQLASLDTSKNPALEKLQCYDNQLTELDVSKNPVLVWLECGDNQLTTLNISKNTALETLSCSNNQLTALDVSNNSALSWLECENNQLPAMDVSANAAFLRMYCEGNAYIIETEEDGTFDLTKLPGFDVTKASNWVGGTIDGNTLTATASFVYYDYDCGNDHTTRFALVDHRFSAAVNAENFPDSNFRSYVSENVDKNGDGSLSPQEIAAVRSIIVSDKSIQSLKGIEYFEMLTYLECDNNQLTELDVSKNPAISHLSCGNNQLTELDVSKNTGLIYLCCDNNRLTAADVSMNRVPLTLRGEGNVYIIETKEDGTFDLTALPGFNAEKATNWVGGTVDGNVLTVHADTVTYDYDCGNNQTMTITLKASKDHAATTMVRAKAATCTENGNKEYWHCSDCGKAFLDKAGTKEAAQENIVIPALGHSFTNYVYNQDARIGVDGTETAACNREGCNATDTRTAAGTALPVPQKPEFVDVPSGAYYADAVDWAAATGVTAGVDNTHFGPDEGCTRAQMVSFLWRAAGEPEPETTESPFTDVQNPNEYYYKAILWAAENGIAAGVGNHQFAPNQTCTRAQIVSFIYRAAGDAETYTENPFKDVALKEYYYQAVLWGAANGVVAGTSDTTFSPNETCTRAQGVSFLHRVYGD